MGCLSIALRNSSCALTCSGVAFAEAFCAEYAGAETCDGVDDRGGVARGESFRTVDLRVSRCLRTMSVDSR